MGWLTWKTRKQSSFELQFYIFIAYDDDYCCTRTQKQEIRLKETEQIRFDRSPMSSILLFNADVVNDIFKC